MKLKYYTELICKLMLYSIIFTLFFTNISSAALLTSNANPTSVFKCGESTISATFNDVGISSVTAWANATGLVSPMIPGSGRVTPEMAAPISDSLSYNGSAWVGTFGDDSSMLWGTRSISYVVVVNGGTHIYPSSSTVFVYNNAGTCTGTGKNSYQNYTSGIGTNTNRLVQGDMDLISWSLYNWIALWGYMFYVIILFLVTSTVYLKTQNAASVLITLFSFMIILAGSGAIPLTFRNSILAFIALCLGAIIWRVFIREN